MNPHSNGFQPPFFPNGQQHPLSSRMIPATFNRPPPPFQDFPPPPMAFRPPGYNSFNSGLQNQNNFNVRPSGFHRPNFNNRGGNVNRFASLPPPIRGPSPIHVPPPVPQRPCFSPDNIFSPPPNMAPTGQEGFPFNTNQAQPQHAPHHNRGGSGGRGRGDWRGRGRGSFANNRPPHSDAKK
ncbi:hypothetical protein EGW08_018307, partial [Elysia chlorotica]